MPLPFLTDQPMTLSRSRSRHWPRIPTGSRRKRRLHVHRDGPAQARLTSACGVAPPVGPHDQSDTDHDDPQPEQRVTNAPEPGRPREPGNCQAETGNHKSTNPLPAGRRLRYGRPPRGRRQAGTTSSHRAERPYPAHNVDPTPDRPVRDCGLLPRWRPASAPVSPRSIGPLAFRRATVHWYAEPPQGSVP